MRAPVILAIAATAAILAAPASAQFAKPEDGLKYRQSAMFIMAQHFGRIGAMVNGRVPYDAKAAADNAEVFADMAKLPWPAFGPGYDKVTPTKAKPEVWSEAGKFKEHAEKLQDAAPKLLAAAKTNSLDNLKTAFANTSQACKGCHDNYRNQ